MHKEEIYVGLGFVEALLAILVTGIASVALMDIAARTMTDTIRNEMMDTMTQYAMEGAEMVQIIADKERLTGDDVFPNESGQAGKCFLMNNDIEDPSFQTDEGGLFLIYSYLEREDFKDDAIILEDEQYFRVFCRTSDIDINGKLVIGKVVVGLVKRDTTENNGQLIFGTGGISNIKDYEHYTIVKL